MMTDAGLHTLTALLLHALSFLVLAVILMFVLRPRDEASVSAV